MALIRAELPQLPSRKHELYWDLLCCFFEVGCRETLEDEFSMERFNQRDKKLSAKEFRDCVWQQMLYYHRLMRESPPEKIKMRVVWNEKETYYELSVRISPRTLFGITKIEGNGPNTSNFEVTFSPNRRKNFDLRSCNGFSEHSEPWQKILSMFGDLTEINFGERLSLFPHVGPPAAPGELTKSAAKRKV
jgi:hypothetical protein